MEKTGVYAIWCRSLDKFYIGQSPDVLRRWRQNRYKLKNHTHDTYTLQVAWDTYGEQDFDFEILEECSPEMLHQREIYWLAMVPDNKKFNIGPAGYSPTLGKVRADASKLRQSRAKGFRPFFATNKITDEVQRFEWGAEAARALSLNPNDIYLCLKGKRESAGGFVFRFDETVLSMPRSTKPAGRARARNREIVGVNIETDKEIHFPFVAAVQGGGFTRTGVIKCLSGAMQTHKGYLWRYADGQPHRVMSEEHRAKLRVGPRKHGGSRAVIGKHVETGEETRFEYVKAAADVLGVKPAMIHHCLAGKSVRAFGYVWRFAGE
jgi:hypothetical protein